MTLGEGILIAVLNQRDLLELERARVLEMDCIHLY
jgi:hypothetical protein